MITSIQSLLRGRYLGPWLVALTLASASHAQRLSIETIGAGTSQLTLEDAQPALLYAVMESSDGSNFTSIDEVIVNAMPFTYSVTSGGDRAFYQFELIAPTEPPPASPFSPDVVEAAMERLQEHAFTGFTPDFFIIGWVPPTVQSQDFSTPDGPVEVERTEASYTSVATIEFPPSPPPPSPTFGLSLDSAEDSSLPQNTSGSRPASATFFGNPRLNITGNTVAIDDVVFEVDTFLNLNPSLASQVVRVMNTFPGIPTAEQIENACLEGSINTSSSNIYSISERREGFGRDDDGQLIYYREEFSLTIERAVVFTCPGTFSETLTMSFGYSLEVRRDSPSGPVIGTTEKSKSYAANHPFPPGL